MKTKSAIATLLTLMGVFVLVRLLPEKPPVLDTKSLVRKDGFSDRLRIAGDSQESVANILITNMPSMLGSSPKDLDSQHRDLLASLAARQASIREEIGKLQVDLKVYLTHNNNEEYEGLLHAIQDSEIDEALRINEERIVHNQVYPAAETAKMLSKRLHEWAAQMARDRSHYLGHPTGRGGYVVLDGLFVVECEQDREPMALPDCNRGPVLGGADHDGDRRSLACFFC